MTAPTDSPYSEYLNPNQNIPGKVETQAYTNPQYPQDQQYAIQQPQYPQQPYPQAQYPQAQYPPYGYAYQQPLQPPPDVVNYNYPVKQPDQQSDPCSLCCLGFVSFLFPIIGWILGCMLPNRKQAQTCTRLATISFIINVVIITIFYVTIAFA